MVVNSVGSLPEFPVSNKKYEKNGKKVKANIGVPMGALITSGMTCSLVSPLISNIRDDMKKMVEYKLKLDACEKNLKMPDGLSKEGTKRAIDFYKKEINEKIPKSIAKGKKMTVVYALLGIAIGIGSCLLINKRRNQKREALYNESVK